MAVSFVAQKAVVAYEASTPTAAYVAPTWRPASVALRINPSTEAENVRSSGSYYPSVVYRTSEGSEGSMEGVPDFRDLTHILNMAFGTPNTASVAEVTGANPVPAHKRHTYTMNTSRPLWRVYYGDGTLWSRARNMFATSLQFEWGKQSATSTITLDLEGGMYEDLSANTVEVPATVAAAAAGVTMTTPIPATALRAEVYMHNTATIFTTTSAPLLASARLNGVLSVTVNYGDLASGVKFFDATNPSVSDVVAGPVDGTFELLIQADATGRGLLEDFREAPVKYVSIRVYGPESQDVPFALWLNFPVMLEEPGERSDEDNVYAANYTYRMVEAGGSIPTAELFNDVTL